MCEPITSVLRDVLAELQLDTCNAKIEAYQAARQAKREAREEAVEEARFSQVLTETIRVIPATEAPPLPLTLKAPVSVFNLAALEITIDSVRSKSAQPRAECYARRMQPQDGCLRVEGAAYPVRWTAADYKREVQRRARQVLPRLPPRVPALRARSCARWWAPTKGASTMPALTEPVKIAIVQGLACFDTPT